MGGHQDNLSPRGYRFPAGLPAEINDDGRTLPCVAQNLSRSGVLLIGPLPAQGVERLDLTLKAATGRLDVRLFGKIIRIEPAEEPGIHRIAIEFVDLSDESKDAVEVLLARVIESPTPTALDGVKANALPHEVRKVLETIPLPQRTSIATRASTRERDLLRHDANASVLDALVRNPSLVPAEARAIAASQFLAPATIEALWADPRFQQDEDLKLALAGHVRVPPPLIDRFIAGLSPEVARRFHAKPGLAPALKLRLAQRMSKV